MCKQKKKRIYQTMQKYGKLTSCNDDSPAHVDELFVQEIEDLYSSQKSLNLDTKVPEIKDLSLLEDINNV